MNLTDVKKQKECKVLNIVACVQ